MTPARALAMLFLAAAAVAFLWMSRPAAAPELSVQDDPAHPGEVELHHVEAAPEPAPSNDGPSLGTVAADEPSAVRRGGVRITIRGYYGAPLPSAYAVLRAHPAGGSQVGEGQGADAKGELWFRDVPLDGSLRAEFYRHDPRIRPGHSVWDALPPADGGKNHLVIRKDELRYRARTGIPVTVRVVDAETGVDVRGARIRYRGASGAGETGWKDAPHTWLYDRPIGRPYHWSFELKAPEGWVRWGGTSSASPICQYARRLEHIQPLRREVPLTVVAREPDGGAVPAKIESLRVAGSSLRVVWKGDATGRLHVRGVPFLRDEIDEVTVARVDGRSSRTLRARVPDHPAGRIELHAELPVEEPFVGPENNGTIGIGGSSSGVFHRHRWRQDNRVRVTVVRHDGTPAVGAAVSAPEAASRHRWVRTNAAGVAVLENLKPGTTTIHVKQAGLLPLSKEVTIPAQGELRVEMREAKGAALRVEVVDDEGKPLSFARLSVDLPSRQRWVDLLGDVQRLDEFTDHRGVRQLSHLEPGTLSISVRWGSRRVVRKINVDAAAEGAVARFVLPRPALDR